MTQPTAHSIAIFALAWPVAAQAPTRASAAASPAVRTPASKPLAVPQTPWREPDRQGVWAAH